MPNLTALSALVVFAPALAGCLLLLSWLQHRRQPALGVWGAGFLTASGAVTLVVIARGTVSDFWSVVVGNAIFAAAYGILWAGARTFEGKGASVLFAMVGVLAWLFACSIGPIYARPEFRAGVMALVGISYTLLAAFELWRGRREGTPRWPIIALLLTHAAAIPTRVPIAGTWKHPDAADVDLLTFAIFEAVFVSICGAYLLGGLVKDRISLGFRRASLTDALTGVNNRRGFFEIGEGLLARARFADQPIALVMFDLDRFKGINDRFGHATGDEILVAFCRLTAEQLRPDDLFARIGGEEFAVLLPNTTSHDAFLLAERVRTVMEAASHTANAQTIRATVSVGVASSRDGTSDLSWLLSKADRALSLAKMAGRNRVETAPNAAPHGLSAA
jgi:diguanylate cyclase (GGDEF)-like protein